MQDRSGAGMTQRLQTSYCGRNHMPERWLQIKGDPSVRAFLFEQQRIESMFDTSIDRLHQIVSVLLAQKGVFHTKIHYSSSQLTCWFARDPFCYEKWVREEVLEEGFLDRFPDTDHAGRVPVLDTRSPYGCVSSG